MVIAHLNVGYSEVKIYEFIQILLMIRHSLSLLYCDSVLYKMGSQRQNDFRGMCTLSSASKLQLIQPADERTCSPVRVNRPSTSDHRYTESCTFNQTIAGRSQITLLLFLPDRLLATAPGSA